MAALEVLALNTTTPQIMAPQSGDTYTFPRAVEMPLGTANGVLYLNGSKVVTSGSGLTFDGTNLGVGTISPIAGSGLTIGDDGNSNATVKLAFSTATTERASIQLNGGSGELRLTAGYAGYGGFQTFFANGSEQMRLTSTGLGIGTNNPGYKLDVNGAINVANNNYIRSGSNPLLASDGSTFNYIYTGTTALAWRNRADTTELMRLDSSGNLGLGVTPSAWFVPAIQTRYGVFAGNDEINCSVNSFTDGLWRYVANGYASRYVQSFGNGNHVWLTAPNNTSGAGAPISFTQAMTLDASGNLGVGVTSPTGGFRLDLQATTARQRIESTTGTNQVEQRLINTGGTFYVSLDNSTGGGFGAAYAATLWYTGNYPMLFATNNAERARIPAAGGMVVGTAAIATTATDGFLYVPTCAGTPTGTPTTQTGTAPIVVDTTNNKLYFYSGGQWRDAGP